jgi:O-antigen ligase
MCIAFLLLIRRKFGWARAIKENAWVIALVVFMLASIFWSDIPFISFKRWTKEFLAILMAFFVISEPFPRQAMESIFRRTIYILIPFSLFLIKYYPKFGVNYSWSGGKMWIGVTLHKNRLGQLCLIAAFFLIWSLVRRWQGRNPSVMWYQTHLEIFILLLVLYLMRGPGGVYSASAIAALAIGLLIYFGCSFAQKSKKIMGSRTVIIIVAAIILLGIVSVFNKGSIVSKFAPVLGRDETLTDRTQIWASLVSVVMQRPILGRGIGFWRPRTRDLYQISEGHSGYLDGLLELGFVGILLISMFFFSSARKAQNVLSHDFDWGILWICYLIMALLHNITESSISSLASFFTTVVLFLSVFSVKHLLVGRASTD